MKNVTTPAPPTMMAPGARRNQLIVLAAIVIVFVILVRACSAHQTKYEHIARELTEAVQKNDYNATAKLENAETVVQMGHGRLGAAADALGPLGAVRNVKDITPPGEGQGVHEFELTFAKGSVHETIQFDPEDKVVHFGYSGRKLNP